MGHDEEKYQSECSQDEEPHHQPDPWGALLFVGRQLVFYLDVRSGHLSVLYLF